MNKLSYRPDIDGLRALAVLAVVLFHGRLGLSGGYVGVDVFFVISGYLITSIILKDIDEGRFSLAAFWERRVRRIFPALLAVVLGATVAGWFVLLPEDFRDFGGSVGVQAVFGGNFFFWLSSGYFETAATFKPLLHTWSLAVEEQYYLIVPFLAVFGLTSNRKTLIRILGSIFVLSLVLSIVLTRQAAEFAFYLLPTRAWELAIGGLLATLPRPSAVPTIRLEVAGGLGLLATLASMALFNHKTPFPGSAALLPCLGTAAMIWANGAAPTLLARALAWRPLVFVGKISYSLYLWHWPVLVYSEYWSINGLHWQTRSLLMLGAVVLATLSWWLVETPFRTRRMVPARGPLFRFAVVSLAAYLGLGGLVVLLRGMPSRFSAEVVTYMEGKRDFPFAGQAVVKGKRALQADYPLLGNNSNSPPYCLVWGDSHSLAILPAIDSLTKEGHSSTAVSAYFNAAPILGVRSSGLKEGSVAWCQAAVDYVKAKRIANVLLVARWRLHSSLVRVSDRKLEPAEFGAKLGETVSALQRAGAKVWILKEVPNHSVLVPKALAWAAYRGVPVESMGIATEKEYAEASRAEDQLLAPSARLGATILDPKPFFAGPGGYCKTHEAGYSLYRDRDHLSSHGAALLRPLFKPIWENGDAAKQLK